MLEVMINAHAPRSSIQAEASRRNGACSHGPKTPAGKLTSSKNAIKHGGFARSVLLPGESESDYEAHLESWLTTLGATSPVLVALAGRIADISFRQERVRRQEEAILAAKVEERTASTMVGAKLSVARDALGAVQGLAILSEGVARVMPARDVRELLPAMTAVLEAAMASDVSLPLARALGTTIETITADTILEVVPESFVSLAHVCRAVEQALVAKISELETAVEQERERIGREMYFADLREIRRLGPVRARLSKELDGALEVFKRARELASQASTAAPCPPCRVELHVVGSR